MLPATPKRSTFGAVSGDEGAREVFCFILLRVRLKMSAILDFVAIRESSKGKRDFPHYEGLDL